MSFKIVAIVYLFGLTLAEVSSHTTNSVTFVAPELQTAFKNVHEVEELPDGSYEYQIVPTSDYAMTEYQSSNSSITDLILSPISALVYVGSTAMSAIGWVLSKLSYVFFGMVIVVGFCACTSYCTITVENPFSKEFRLSIPYLDEMEYYVVEAYNKYHNMQTDLLS